MWAGASAGVREHRCASPGAARHLHRHDSHCLSTRRAAILQCIAVACVVITLPQDSSNVPVFVPLASPVCVSPQPRPQHGACLCLQVKGQLRGYDQFLNLVLDNTIEEVPLPPWPPSQPPVGVLRPCAHRELLVALLLVPPVCAVGPCALLAKRVMSADVSRHGRRHICLLA